MTHTVNYSIHGVCEVENLLDDNVEQMLIKLIASSCTLGVLCKY